MVWNGKNIFKCTGQFGDAVIVESSTFTVHHPYEIRVMVNPPGTQTIQLMGWSMSGINSDNVLHQGGILRFSFSEWSRILQKSWTTQYTQGCQSVQQFQLLKEITFLVEKHSPPSNITFLFICKCWFLVIPIYTMNLWDFSYLIFCFLYAMYTSCFNPIRDNATFPPHFFVSSPKCF